jgi:D-sedoheptulose 7-phosphate isomerase
MKDIQFIKNRTNEAYNLVNTLDFESAVQFAKNVFNLIETKPSNNKVIFMGNGASYTIANHASLDYMSQIGVTTMVVSDPAVLTAFSNDFGYDQALKRFVQINYNPGDILVCISSSGNSQNVVNAAEYVKTLGGNVISFTGFSKDNKLSQIADQNFWVDSKVYNVVESIHNLWLAMICDLLIEWMGEKVGPHGLEFK